MSRVYITMDFEAGWGAIGNNLWRVRERAGVYRDLRDVLGEVVARLDEREITLTWAVVGAMIDAGAVDLSHLSGAYRERAEQFLSHAEPMTRDGRDLLEIVQRTRQPQGFATHGYSHVSFQDPDQSAEVFSAEMARALAANRAAGLSARTLVFPRNEAGALDAVRRAGIEKIRLPPMGHQPRGKLGRALAAIFLPPAKVIEKSDGNGLVRHTGTAFLNWGKGANSLKRAVTRRHLSQALAMAAANEGDVHFWLHPFNLVETEGLYSYFLTFIDEIGTLRDRDRIDVAKF